MTKATGRVLDDALRLSTAERADLAANLLASLEGEPDEDAEVAWAAEIEQRANRVRSGDAQGRSWPEVRDHLQRRRQ